LERKEKQNTMEQFYTVLTSPNNRPRDYNCRTFHEYLSFYLTKGGKLYWRGQFLHLEALPQKRPWELVPVPFSCKVRAVSVGNYWALLLTEQGQVYNYGGVRTNLTEGKWTLCTETTSSGDVQPLKGIVKIYATNYTAFCLDSTGGLYQITNASSPLNRSNEQETWKRMDIPYKIKDLISDYYLYVLSEEGTVYYRRDSTANQSWLELPLEEPVQSMITAEENTFLATQKGRIYVIGREITLRSGHKNIVALPLRSGSTPPSVGLPLFFINDFHLFLLGERGELYSAQLRAKEVEAYCSLHDDYYAYFGYSPTHEQAFLAQGPVLFWKKVPFPTRINTMRGNKCSLYFDQKGQLRLTGEERLL